jgi:hypothetical protein
LCSTEPTKNPIISNFKIQKSIQGIIFLPLVAAGSDVVLVIGSEKASGILSNLAQVIQTDTVLVTLEQNLFENDAHLLPLRLLLDRLKFLGGLNKKTRDAEILQLEKSVVNGRIDSGRFVTDTPHADVDDGELDGVERYQIGRPGRLDVDVNVATQARASTTDDGQQDQVVVEGIEERIDPVSVAHHIGDEQK